jgi:hypothetical protein
MPHKINNYASSAPMDAGRACYRGSDMCRQPHQRYAKRLGDFSCDTTLQWRYQTLYQILGREICRPSSDSTQLPHPRHEFHDTRTHGSGEIHASTVQQRYAASHDSERVDSRCRVAVGGGERPVEFETSEPGQLSHSQKHRECHLL